MSAKLREDFLNIETLLYSEEEERLGFIHSFGRHLESTIYSCSGTTELAALLSAYG